MKNYNQHVPAASKLNLLRQIGNFIPEFLTPKLARATEVQDKARSFSPWSHLVALMYAQLTHSIGLNDVYDALGLHSGPLSSLRGATPPKRNTLSHANKVRPAAMAEKLFGAVLEHLGSLSPGFVSGHADKLQPALHAGPSGVVEKVGCVELAAKLWDSRRPFPLPGPARTSLPAGVGIELWDSPASQPPFLNVASCELNRQVLC